jgi:hypothetical protein
MLTMDQILASNELTMAGTGKISFSTDTHTEDALCIRYRYIHIRL